MLTIKLTDEEEAQFGIKTRDDAIRLFSAGNQGPQSGTMIADLRAEFQAFKDQLASISGRVKAVEDRASFDAAARESVVKEAVAEAGKVTAQAIANIGATRLKANPEPGDESTEKAPKTAKERFEADEKLQAEFGTFEVWEAYENAEQRGQARIFRTAASQN